MNEAPHELALQTKNPSGLEGCLACTPLKADRVNPTRTASFTTCEAAST